MENEVQEEIASFDEGLEVALLKSSILRPPSTEDYNLTNDNKEESMGQGQLIRKLFQNRVNIFTYMYLILTDNPEWRERDQGNYVS